MNLDGANVKSVTTPEMKMQEWTPQVLTKNDKDRAPIFRSATMRASIHVYQPRGCAAGGEGSGTLHGRAERGMVRYLVGHGGLMQVISEQRHVKAPRVDTGSDYAGRAYQVEHDVRSSLPWRQPDQSRELDARHTKFECCFAESEFYAGVKSASTLLGAKSMTTDFGAKRCTVCSWYRQQFSQEYPRETWSRTGSISTLSRGLVTRT